MFANQFIQPLISILTKRGRQTRALARKFDLELTEAFSLVRSAGSPELAEQKLQSQRDEQKRLSSLLWNSPNRYKSGPAGKHLYSGLQTLRSMI